MNHRGTEAQRGLRESVRTAEAGGSEGALRTGEVLTKAQRGEGANWAKVGGKSGFLPSKCVISGHEWSLLAWS